MRIVFFTLFVIFFGYNLSILEAQNSKKKVTIAVLNFQAMGNIDQADASALTVHMRKQLAKRNNIYVFSPEETDIEFTKNNIQPTDPFDTAFVLQAGRILNADFIITGQISGVNNKYTVEIRMLSVLSGNVVDSYKKDYAGDISGLVEIIKRIASGLSQNIRYKKSKKTVEIVPHYWFIGLEGGFPLTMKRKWDGRFTAMVSIERNLSKNIILGFRTGYIDYNRNVFYSEKPKLTQYPFFIQISFISPGSFYTIYPGMRFMAGVSIETFKKRYYTETIFDYGIIFRKNLHKNCYLQLCGDVLFSSSDPFGPYGNSTYAVYAGIGYRIGK